MMAGSVAQPSISVIIPAYNAERWIDEAVGSVVAQTLGDWELVVVDDGSTDTTAAHVIAFGDPRIRLLRQANAGQSAAQNRGIDAARGARVLLLDADDRLRPHALSWLSQTLDQNPDCALAYGAAAYVREDGSPFRRDLHVRITRKPSGDVLRAILRQNFVGFVGAVMMSRAALIEAGGFRTDLVVAQDWELWCRMAARHRFAYAGSRVVYEYRLHTTSIIHSRADSADSQREAIEAVFGDPLIRQRLSPRTLDRLERARWADAAVLSAVQQLRTGRRESASGQLKLALEYDPRSLRAWLLTAAMRFPALPGPLKRRLGIDDSA